MGITRPIFNQLSQFVTNYPQKAVLPDSFHETPDIKDEMKIKDRSRTCLGEA
jgi:hypothetical protein